MSSKSNKGHPSTQYRLQLNTIEQDGYAKFDIKYEETGPTNKPTWVFVVTVESVHSSLSKSIKIGTSCQGTGSTKGEAKDAACEEMVLLFADYNISPKIGS
ncbi:hypothetical protein M407DRAFT_125276 [Tulasnella calospora MUT 4182]|uniref:DRBM domain-containing protein n=1 Tax=Tulasnella calospora MUT 4182 TaxID=1051891 RepID=A0A0C3QA24_9AGAM|nr:hypothetical protein M407DRAFT_125276 [Tulasnella calospora MUT 4182]